MRVLIVETDSEIIRDIRMAFNKYEPDWQLTVIDTGIQCLTLIKGFRCPDIVISGVQLSDMSGFELTEHIRDDSETPILILSRDKDVNTLVKAFDVGAHDYIEVPFNNSVFIARIKAKLRRCKWDNHPQERKSMNIKGQRIFCHSISGESER
jgi:DNA-binding response OmpR family regulator